MVVNIKMEEIRTEAEPPEAIIPMAQSSGGQKVPPPQLPHQVRFGPQSCSTESWHPRNRREGYKTEAVARRISKKCYRRRKPRIPQYELV
jgi:hypothetical protein